MPRLFENDPEANPNWANEVRINRLWLIAIFACFAAVFALGVLLFGDSLKSFEERVGCLAAFCLASWFVPPFSFLVKQEAQIHPEVSTRPVSMHEYLDEKAAWRTTERLDGKADSDLEPEYNPETHDLVVKGIRCFEIAEDYRYGHSIPANRYLANAWYEHAIPWFLRAAEKGDGYAQERMGNFCSEGLGIAADMNEALRWWRESASNGRISAQYRLGENYYFGQGVDKNLSEALFWFEVVLASHPAGFAEEKRQAKMYSSQSSEAMLTEVRGRVKQWFLDHPKVRNNAS